MTQTPHPDGQNPPGHTAHLNPAGAVPPGLQKLSTEDEAALRALRDGEWTGFTSGEDGAKAALAAKAAEAEAAESHRRELNKTIRQNPALLLEMLPEMLGPAIASMVTNGVTRAVQVLLENGLALPVKVTGLFCVVCMGNRMTWMQRHAADVERARQQAMAMVGTGDPADPRVAQMDLPSLLPENLRPGQPDGLPLIFDAATILEGTGAICPQHHPMAAKASAGLILMPGVSASAAARLAMSGGMGG